MSTSDQESSPKGKQSNQNNSTVIEIKVTIPPILSGNLGGFLEHMGKAAREVAKAGRTFISSDDNKPVKMRKIEIK